MTLACLLLNKYEGETGEKSTLPTSLRSYDGQESREHQRIQLPNFRTSELAHLSTSVFQCQPFEKMFLVLENQLQRVKGQRFPETPGAG
jgi:hypothetical protein